MMTDNSSSGLAMVDRVVTTAAPRRMGQGPAPPNPAKVDLDCKVMSNVMLVTPEWAARKLQANNDNRTRRVRRVSQYARDMASGHFTLSDSAICFDADGNLVNGQHRLEACVQSGQSFWSIIAYDVPRECRVNFDQGLNRRLHDALHYSGFAHANSKTGSLLNALPNPHFQGGGARTLTVSEAALLFERHGDAMVFVLERFSAGGRKGTGRAQVRAAVVRAYYHVSHERLSLFVDLLHNRIPPEPGDEAAAVFMQFLLKSGRDVNRVMIHRKAEAAIMHFDNRERITKLYGSTNELFPIDTDV